MTTEPKAAGKNKTVAIVMALFLSFWSWLYTYKKDGWKFWLGFGLIVADVAAYFILLVTSAGAPVESTIAKAFGYETVAGLFVIVVVWVWAFLDAVIKKPEWFRSY